MIRKILFGIGLFSFILLCLYIVSFLIFVFGAYQQREVPEIAFVPKWIFLFSLLILIDPDG